MTSSNSFELRVAARGQVLGTVSADKLNPRALRVVPESIDTLTPAEVVIVRRGDWSHYRGHVRVGGERVAVISPGQEEARFPLRAFRDEFGEVAVTYTDRGPGRARLELRLQLQGPPEIESLYERLFEELESLHVGLAQDVFGRTSHQRGTSRAGASALRPHQEVERLAGLITRIDDALMVIGRQPSQALERRVRLGRYRPGDRIRPGAVGQILTAPGTVVAGGRIRALGLVPALRTRLTTDITEHRHIRSGIERLARRARGLERHCRRAADAFEPERARWGGHRTQGQTVFDQKYAPRIRALEQLAERAATLDARARKLLDEHEVLARAGRPRSRLEPTPIFRNRVGYREIYAVLREMEGLSGALVSGEELRIHYRRLSTLYEYWCFVQTVALISAHAETLAPEALPGFELIDDVYRPELRAGQAFRFPLRTGGSIRVIYEPDIPPYRGGRGGVEPWRATLGRGTLRPDVWIEVARPGKPPLAVVLDAKSKSKWETKMLFAVTDYRTRIIDPSTGHQPVRQVWLLHRDARSRPRCNVPDYLAGDRDRSGNWVLGALACLPDQTHALEQVLERLLG